MDQAMPPEETAAVRSILDSYQARGVSYHALRSRQSAARRFLVAHLLVPGSWTVRKGHQLAEEIETEVGRAIPNSNMVTHLEPIDDPASMRDIQIDRSGT
jgi:divalent metal cation (Fe/Co/Zn/Cd) transporter